MHDTGVIFSLGGGSTHEEHYVDRRSLLSVNPEPTFGQPVNAPHGQSDCHSGEHLRRDTGI